MTDASDALPAGGYVAPAMPQTWLGDDQNFAMVSAALDVALDTARASNDQLAAAHLIATASGGDLDNLAALFGLGRLPGETDALLRLRIPATVSHGISASSTADMATYLTNALGVPVTVTDGPAGSATFTVIVQRNVANLSSVPALVRGVKAAGTTGYVYALVATGATGGPLAGTFRAGDLTVTGGSSLVYVGS